MGEQCTSPLGGEFGEGVQSRQRSPKIDLGGRHWKLQEGALQGGARRETLGGGGKGCGGRLQACKVPTCLPRCKRRPSWGRGSWGKVWGSGRSCCTPSPRPMMHAPAPHPPRGTLSDPPPRFPPAQASLAGKGSCKTRKVRLAHTCLCVCAPRSPMLRHLCPFWLAGMSHRAMFYKP